jgi:cysteine desulfurase
MDTLYFDWAAGAPIDQEVLEGIRDVYFRLYGNPSSIHRAGREAEELLCSSRARLSKLFDCKDDEIIFTSGGTESNNLVLFSLLLLKPGKKLILSGIEHASVYEPAKKLARFGFDVQFVPANRDGFVEPGKIEESLNDRTVMVTLMHVNNETGAVQPVSEVADLIRTYSERHGRKIHFHTDAVQAFGKIPFNPVEMGVDSASFSAHKIGGPRGIGALFLRRGSIMEALYCGGGQEFGLRPGTENTPGIYGFVLAAERRLSMMDEELERAMELEACLIRELLSMEDVHIIPEIRGRIVDKKPKFSPYILSVSFPPIPGEVLVRSLDEKGIFVGTGSACSSKKKERFRVFDSMMVPRDISSSSIRISTGHLTCKSEVVKLLENLKLVTGELREKITGKLR